MPKRRVPSLGCRFRPNGTDMKLLGGGLVAIWLLELLVVLSCWVLERESSVVVEPFGGGSSSTRHPVSRRERPCVRAEMDG